MTEPIGILLVDPQALLRDCLATVLNRRRGFQVVGEAATGDEALAAARELHPAVVVVDPDVPGGGATLVADLVRETPDAAVLALGTDSLRTPSRVLRAGARGYLSKNCDAAELARAIERVHQGELVVDSSAAPTVLKDLQPRAPRAPSDEVLTARELEVLELIAQGRTNAEIARELCITEHTTKGHLAKILAKLGLDNRVQLATYATQRGFGAAADVTLLHQAAR